MEEYLGFKTLKGNKLDIVALVVFGLMCFGSVSVLLDDIRNGNDKNSVGAGILLLVLFAWGVIAAVLRMLDRALAYKIAEYFYTYPKTEIYEDLLGKELKMTSPAKKILKLQRRKYMQGINYDPSNRCFFAYIKQSVPREAAGVPVKCPQCGANCTVYPERALNKCPFCDLQLVIGVNIDLL